MSSNLNDGATRIAAERERQKAVERWTPEHDAEHDDQALAMAAACYAIPEDKRLYRNHADGPCPVSWPWDAEWWKPGDRIRELEKAGALIAAEIDRLLAKAQP